MLAGKASVLLVVYWYRWKSAVLLVWAASESGDDDAGRLSKVIDRVPAELCLRGLGGVCSCMPEGGCLAIIDVVKRRGDSWRFELKS